LLDQGTTSSRAMLFDHAVSVVAVEQAEFREIFLQLGWVAHDVLQIWQKRLKTAKNR
jgi:glycerol kinase